MIDGQGFISGRGWIFVSATASRLALKHIQPPVRWVMDFLCLGVKRLACEVDHSAHITKVKNVWISTPMPSHTENCPF
jgi:hypothetical protein